MTRHAAAEPLLVALLIAAPFLFGFDDVGSAPAVSIVAGLLILLVSMSTCWRLSLVKVVPLLVHAMADLGLGALLVASPFLFGFHDDSGAATAFFGGLSSLVFGFGAFLVIVFLFLPIIGQAATARAQAAVDRLDADRAAKLRQMQKEKKTPEEIQKADEEFAKKKESLEDDARNVRIANIRDVWMERYGMMFGFVFLMFGSIGFLMPQHTATRRVVGAVVICAQMVLVFI